MRVSLISLAAAVVSAAPAPTPGIIGGRVLVDQSKRDAACLE